MLDPFQLEFVQRGVLEVLLLSLAAGLLGTWIVMRGLSFYAHAVGTAAFPGLVLADGLGFSAPLGAFAAALVFAFGVERLARRPRAGYDSLTALVLVAALAGGVVLASDVFESGGNVDSLLFGSLLLAGTRDLVLAGLASAAAVAGTLVLGPRWLARGFDPASARALGMRSGLPDAAAAGARRLRGGRLAHGDRRAARDRAVRRARGDRAPLDTAPGRLATGVGGARGDPGDRGPVALGRAEHPAGADGRRARWRAVRPVACSGMHPETWCGGAQRSPARLCCSRSSSLPAEAARRRGDTGPRVVATTTQIGDWTRAVAGDAARVHQILQPNTDPHDYEPRPADVEAVAGAKLVFLNGDGLDAWMGTVISNAGGSPEVVDLGSKVPVRMPGQSEGSEASRYDPHWWHDPRNAEAAVKVIRDALAEANPAAAATYRANAAAYLRRLEALDAGIRRCLARVPEARRKLVSDHDAFGYFAHRYGIQVVGAVIPSQTTQAQASAGDIAALVRLIRREGVRAVFPESSLSPKLAEQIARETGARSGYTLYGDTLGPSDSAGATYLSMERANADEMTRGFTGGARGCRIGGLA